MHDDEAASQAKPSEHDQICEGRDEVSERSAMGFG